MTPFRLFGLLATLLIATSASALEPIETGLKFGYLPQLRWMDNQRLLVIAETGRHCADKKDYRQPLAQLAIYDLRSGKVEWVGPDGVSAVCYDRGNLTVSVRRHAEGQCPEFAFDGYGGRLEGWEVKLLEKGVPIDLNDCLVRASLPEGLAQAGKERRIEALRREHGYLEVTGPLRRQYPYRLHRIEGTEIRSIDLPDVFNAYFDQGKYQFDRVGSRRYYPHQGAYLLRTWHEVMPPPHGAEMRLWWLYPDGRIEEFVRYATTPDWPEVMASQTYATRRGMVFRGENRRITPYVGEAGLYWHRPGKKPERLVAGRLVRDMEVSPDGCKVAYGNDDRFRHSWGPNEYKVQILNLCRKEAR